MENPPFPYEHFLSSLVRFLDAIKYEDKNYSHDERVKTLQYVYSETAKHFAQPTEQDVLQVNPKRLASVMRTTTRVSVYCWVKVSPQVMADVSIYFVYVVLLDDSNVDPAPDMESFFQDLLEGKQQKHPFWRLMNGHFSKFLQRYGSFCALAILRSTFDYFQACWIETHNFRGFPGSHYFPLFLRRLNALGGICAGSLFPKEDFDEKAMFKEITSVVAQLEPMNAFVNDMISFYKEYDNPRDQVGLVMNICEVEGISMNQAFDRLTQDTIQSCEQLLAIIDGERASKVADTLKSYVHGYVTWHIVDERFRMHEVYERAGESADGLKFRKYYEMAMQVGNVDRNDWVVSLPMINGFKDENLILTGDVECEARSSKDEISNNGNTKDETLQGEGIRDNGAKDDSFEGHSVEDDKFHTTGDVGYVNQDTQDDRIKENGINGIKINGNGINDNSIAKQGLHEEALQRESITQGGTKDKGIEDDDRCVNGHIKGEHLKDAQVKDRGSQDGGLQDKATEDGNLHVSGDIKDEGIKGGITKDMGLQGAGLQYRDVKDGDLHVMGNVKHDEEGLKDEGVQLTGILGQRDSVIKDEVPRLMGDVEHNRNIKDEDLHKIGDMGHQDRGIHVAEGTS